MSEDKLEEIRQLVIEIGAMGGRFVGEHNMVHTPTLEYYVNKILVLFQPED